MEPKTFAAPRASGSRDDRQRTRFQLKNCCRIAHRSSSTSKCNPTYMVSVARSDFETGSGKVTVVKTHLSQISRIKKHNEISLFGISPMTTETFTADGALFRRKRLANCNVPRNQQKRCAATSNATSKQTHDLAKHDDGARHMQASTDSHTDNALIAQLLLSKMFMKF